MNTPSKLPPVATTTSDPVFLFLDFDGVLHRFFPIEGDDDKLNAHFAFAPAFEVAVRACNRPVKIVITSTWRRKYSLDEIKARFAPDIAAMIIGVTPMIESGNGPGGRLAEVQAWLKNNGGLGAAWVGVDDFPTLYGEGAVVACHDGFFDRERALLVEAVDNPSAFAEARPCEYDGPRRRIGGTAGA